MPNIRNVIADPANIRQALHDKLCASIQAMFPIEARDYVASIDNISVKHINLSHNQQREVFMLSINRV